MMSRTTRTAILGLTIILAAACAVDDGEAPIGTDQLENSSNRVHTARQAKQIVMDLFNRLPMGDLEGYVAGLTEDVVWNVNSQFLPWGGRRVGQDAVIAFFQQVLSVVTVTSFAEVPEETIAERLGPCRFLVDLKTVERVASLRDPTQMLDVHFRYVNTVGCDGLVSSIDIYDDSGAVEHMLKAAGDLPP